MRNAACIALGSIVMLVSCARAPTPLVQRKGDVISFFAAINPETAAQFERLASKSTKALIIDSMGGDTRSAIEMAETIHRLGMSVDVWRQCWSACAQYIFVAGRERRIAPNSLVVFHDTASSIARLGAAHPRPDSSTWQAFVDAKAALEQKLYAQLGVSQDLLYEPMIKIGTRCVGYVPDSRGRVRDLAFKSVDIAWIPSRQTLSKWGISFSGFWPTDGQTLKRAALLTFRHDRHFNIVLSTRDDSISTEALNAAYSKIEMCRTPIPASLESNAPAWSDPYAAQNGQ